MMFEDEEQRDNEISDQIRECTNQVKLSVMSPIVIAAQLVKLLSFSMLKPY